MQLPSHSLPRSRVVELEARIMKYCGVEWVELSELWGPIVILKM